MSMRSLSWAQSKVLSRKESPRSSILLRIFEVEIENIRGKLEIGLGRHIDKIHMNLTTHMVHTLQSGTGSYVLVLILHEK